MEDSHYVPSPLSSPDLIDQAVDLLTQDIEQTSRLVFEKYKPSSLKAAVWWDKSCTQVATAVCEATTADSHSTTLKALNREVCAVKRCWANDFLHNATPDCLWTAAKW